MGTGTGIPATVVGVVVEGEVHSLSKLCAAPRPSEDTAPMPVMNTLCLLYDSGVGGKDANARTCECVCVRVRVSVRRMCVYPRAFGPILVGDNDELQKQATRRACAGLCAPSSAEGQRRTTSWVSVG